MTTFKTPDLPRVGFVSLGCPKATVDSEHILTRLRAERAPLRIVLAELGAEAGLVGAGLVGFEALDGVR